MTLQTPSNKKQKLDFKTPDGHSQNGPQNTEATLNAPPC